jgi:hypothetical protein
MSAEQGPMTKRRGFAAMPKHRQLELAAAGGGGPGVREGASLDARGSAGRGGESGGDTNARCPERRHVMPHVGRMWKHRMTPVLIVLVVLLALALLAFFGT